MSEKPKNRNSKSGEEADIKTVEEGFALLDEAVKKLSDENITLEESFSEFEKGMKVLKAVSGKIDRVEKKVQLLNEEKEYLTEDDT